MYKRQIALGEPNPSQVQAINTLTAKYDGHVGLLKISQCLVSEINSPAQLENFLNEHESLGGDAKQFYAALFNRFRNALTEDSLELCRRLTIAFRPFKKYFAEHLWKTPEKTTAFEDAWNFCLAGVFEVFESSRFNLPKLYVEGLEQYNNPDETKDWHRLAADALQMPHENVVEASDFLDSIFHRLLSGQLSQAVLQAAVLLAMAVEDQQTWYVRFLLVRLEAWLEAPVAKSNDINTCLLYTSPSPRD